MSVSILNPFEIYTFFAVMVRFGIMIAVFPFFGDASVPQQVKILLGLILTIIIYPTLVSSHLVDPGTAEVWTSSVSGIFRVIGLEALFGIAVGFTGRIIFAGIQVAGDLMGTFMGFASASQYDPHSESNSQVVAKIQVALATILFLILDGHHLMLAAGLDSYRVVGLGGMQFSGSFMERLIGLSGEMIRLGLQMAAPMAAAIFSVNVVYGIMAKSMPQLNVLILSFSVSALIGLFVLLLGSQEYAAVTRSLFAQSGDRIYAMMSSLGTR